MRVVVAGDRGCVEVIREHSNSDVTAPADYDLVLNVGAYALLRAEPAVLMAYLAKFCHLLTEKRGSESHSIAVSSPPAM